MILQTKYPFGSLCAIQILLNAMVMVVTLNLNYSVTRFFATENGLSGHFLDGF